MTEDLYTRMKHTFSYLPDLVISCSFDDEKKWATAVVNHFDSILVTMFFRSLERDGMLCIENESDYANHPAPPWRILFVIDDVKYLCRVVLRPRGETAVYLLPQPQKN